MKALVYDGPREVHVKDVPDARIENPTDVLVKITSTNICGSDLHMYEGRTDLEPGMVLGHENLGIVAEVGNAVVKVSPGDRVCLPFNIGCGFCRNCEEGLTAFCLTVHPDPTRRSNFNRCSISSRPARPWTWPSQRRQSNDCR
ncbi:alcohol dehydrogenase catalytic domain-containing protein [Rhodococcus qingshengii]|uniref:alcohol dehydrogenase catalytic domain-containing protein n=1 Tax=Rhodococcus qingshengii TaxID=334542 RepID=UPI0024BAA7C2|nr:alcohol dehydrogenase catalytic domain-containing protein [Rhodococcus qingshengii]MDJ0435890.1 alcohol dehydrogenase catalytic domain-containing protein [Rhodococcus qingshengii]